jgi:hypothetical protein
MSMLFTYKKMTPAHKAHWKTETELNHQLSGQFEHLMSLEFIMSHVKFNQIRDWLRDYLYERNPAHFLRHSSVGTSVTGILEYLMAVTGPALSVVYTCPSSHPCGEPIYIPTEHHLDLVLSEA